MSITDEMLEKNPFFQKGKQEGKKEGLQEAVVRLYESGKTPEEIASLLKMSLQEVNGFLKSKSG
ncbi:MAG: hypothetical protein GXO22_06180 [Aquificae bacterium]|nr:hypothetical protein [Aquificota bacterium]